MNDTTTTTFNPDTDDTPAEQAEVVELAEAAPEAAVIPIEAAKSKRTRSPRTPSAKPKAAKTPKARSTLLAAKSAKAPATYTIDGALFASTVATVARASGKTGLLTLTFKDQRVTLSATDLETAISVKLPVKGKRGATVSVEAASLARFTGALKGEVVEISVDGDMTIRAGETVYEQRHLDGAAVLPEGEPVKPVELDFPNFVRVVNLAAPCASTDDARPILTAVYFHDGKAVATDSFRLAVIQGAPKIGKVLIPAVAAKLATKVFEADEEVTIDVRKNDVVLTSGDKRFQTRRIDGEYPNYENLVRKDSPITVRVPRAQLVAALDKVALAAAGSTPARVNVAKGVMHLSVKAIDRHTADAQVTLTETTTGVPSIAVNADYARQMFRVAPDDNVRIGYVDSLQPLLIDDGSARPKWQMLLMPVRVPN